MFGSDGVLTAVRQILLLPLVEIYRHSLVPLHLSYLSGKSFVFRDNRSFLICVTDLCSFSGSPVSFGLRAFGMHEFGESTW